MTLASPANLKQRRLAQILLTGTLALALLHLCPTPGHATENPADPVKIASSSESGIEWKVDPTLQEKMGPGGARQIIATIEGTLPASGPTRGASILRRGVELARDKETGKLRFEEELTGKETAIRLVIVSPDGGVRNENLTLVHEGWKTEGAAAVATVTEAPTRPIGGSKSWLMAGVGMSSLQFRQTRALPMDEKAVTLKASLTLPSGSPSFDYGMTLYYTLHPLPADRAFSGARYFGANLLGRYSSPWLKAPWHVAVAGGLYYATMGVSGDLLGYRDLLGPSLNATVSRDVSARHRVALSVKFAPLLGGDSFPSTANRELALGAIWSTLLGNGHLLMGTLDISDLSLTAGSTSVSSKSTTFGVAYGL